MITVKIDVTKIDKSRLFKGQKGTYLDICLIETPDSKFGDSHMVVQSVSKEEREAGTKGAILGNAKSWGDSQRNAQPPRQPATAAATKEENDEDVPF